MILISWPSFDHRKWILHLTKRLIDHVNIYYIDRALSDDELLLLDDYFHALECHKQIQLRCIIPVSTKGSSVEENLQSCYKQIKKTPVIQDIGNQVVFVMPKRVDVGTRIIHAVAEITGYFPYIFKTEEFLKSMEIDGPAHIIDGHALSQ